MPVLRPVIRAPSARFAGSPLGCPITSMPRPTGTERDAETLTAARRRAAGAGGPVTASATCAVQTMLIERSFRMSWLRLGVSGYAGHAMADNARLVGNCGNSSRPPAGTAGVHRG
jgi:hypothetical protein